MSPEQLKREVGATFNLVNERSNDQELCIICPVPGCADRSGNRSINVKTLRTWCWHCGEKGPMHVKSLFRIAGVEFVDNYILEPSELLEMFKTKPQKALTPVQEVPLPEGFTLLSENKKSCYWKFCKSMAEQKHLTIEDLEQANAGFTREGIWEPFCIFPVIEGPRIVYYQGRTYTDEGFENTKKFPSKGEVPYGASYWVYNLDALADPAVELVIVVESILNVLSLKKRLRDLELDRTVVPVCIFTHRLGRSQLAKFYRYRHVKEWCFLFDSDSTELAHETALGISAALKTSVAEMPTGTHADGSIRKTNDANDDVDAALLAIDARRKSTPERHHRSAKYPPQDRPYYG